MGSVVLVLPSLEGWLESCVEALLDCGMEHVHCAPSTTYQQIHCHPRGTHLSFKCFLADYSHPRPDNFGNFLRRPAFAMASTFHYASL
jgi:hypothetical protein